MPINQFQRDVLKLLAANRAPDSYVAGATVINRADDSPRYSADIDIFNDPNVSVQACALIDRSTLSDHGYEVSTLIEQRGFVRCLASKGRESVKLEWVVDTAFRFFPTIADPQFGYRLHDIDAAINKAIALANRTEIRDVIDILTIHADILHLGLCCWAACGKDQGFTPDLILDMLSRNAKITPDLLAAEQLRGKIDPANLKARWITALDEARLIVSQLPIETLGCVFTDLSGDVLKSVKTVDGLTRHFGKVGGCLPQVIAYSVS